MDEFDSREATSVRHWRRHVDRLASSDLTLPEYASEFGLDEVQLARARKYFHRIEQAANSPAEQQSSEPPPVAAPFRVLHDRPRHACGKCGNKQVHSARDLLPDDGRSVGRPRGVWWLDRVHARRELVDEIGPESLSEAEHLFVAEITTSTMQSSAARDLLGFFGPRVVREVNIGRRVVQIVPLDS